MRHKAVTTGLIAVIIFEVAIGAVLFIFKQSTDQKKDAIVEHNTQTQTKLSTQQNELTPAKALQAQLKNLSRLVDSHLYWTNFFDELSQTTLKTVQYTQLQADLAGTVYVEGLAANYADLGKLLLGLSTSKNFTDVRLLSSSPNSGEISGLSFALNFKINPQLLTNHE